MIRTAFAALAATAALGATLIAPAAASTAELVPATTVQPAAQQRVDIGGGWQLCLGDDCPDHAVVDVSVANGTTCVVVSAASGQSRSVWCWGKSPQGGTGAVGAATGPIRVAVPGEVAAVAVGPTHTCAISEVNKVKGTVWCWGSNFRGELGTTAVSLGQATTVPQRVLVAGKALRGVRDLHAGWSSTCALTGKVLCWGWGQGVNWSDTAQPRELPVPEPKAFASTTGPGICLITGDGLYCQSGTDAEYSRTPGSASLVDAAPCDGQGTCAGVTFRRKTGTGAQTTVAAAGRYRGCTVTGGALGCWGSNASESSGFNADDALTGVPGGVRYDAKRPGKWTPGKSNLDGRLGTASTALHEANPVAVARAPKKVSTLGAGVGFSCATSSGDIWCWGRNDWGQVGIAASSTIVTAPTKLDIQTSHPYRMVVGGAAHACALATDGDLWCWGNNLVRQSHPASNSISVLPTQLTFLPPS